MPYWLYFSSSLAGRCSSVCFQSKSRYLRWWWWWRLLYCLWLFLDCPLYICHVLSLSKSSSLFWQCSLSSNVVSLNLNYFWSDKHVKSFCLQKKKKKNAIVFCDSWLEIEYLYQTFHRPFVRTRSSVYLF